MPESLETTVNWGVMVNRAQNLQGEACGLVISAITSCVNVLQKGGPLPGLKTGLLSNTRK